MNIFNIYLDKIKEQENEMFQEAMREAKDKMALRLKRKEEKERGSKDLRGSWEK